MDVASTLDQILKLAPNTTKVFVVMGNSPIEKLWLVEMRKLFQPLTSRLEIIYSDDLSLEEILKQVAVLPPPVSSYTVKCWWTPTAWFTKASEP